ncbi:ubiquitin-activating enzyme E1 family protein, partial [Cardiosporidium cionae]
GIPPCLDLERIKRIARKIHIPAFRPKQLRIKVDENDPTVEGAGDDESENDRIKQQLLDFSGISNLTLNPVSFEKDDDSNFHIAFITACANLRARNYKIMECSYHHAKMIAGKIIPAVATTTAMTAGLVTLELLKTVTYNERSLEDFKNAFINLALPLWLYSEPLPPTKATDSDFDPIAYGPVKARPHGFTSWDKINVMYENGNLKQLQGYLKENFNMDVMIISSGSACLYNAFLAKHRMRLERPILELYEEIMKFKIPAKRKYLTIEVSGNDVQDGVEVIIPSIRYQFR